MAEIRFYHLEHYPQDRVLPALLGKAYARGHRIVVKLNNEAEVERMNSYLWEYLDSSFLPHGSVKNGKAAEQPIWLTHIDENPNKADVLIVCQGASTDMREDFDLCCEMLNGHNPEELSGARVLWKEYKDKGVNITYWQQNDQGAWDKKA